MAANSFPKDMDYRQEALQDKATASKYGFITKPKQRGSHFYIFILWTYWLGVKISILLSNAVPSSVRLFRDHIRGPVHSIQLRPFLLFLFFSEPELRSWCFKFHPLCHVLLLLLFLLFRAGAPVCAVSVTSAAAGPGPPASAPPSTSGYTSDEQRQHGHG